MHSRLVLLHSGHLRSALGMSWTTVLSPVPSDPASWMASFAGVSLNLGSGYCFRYRFLSAFKFGLIEQAELSWIGAVRLGTLGAGSI